MKRGFTLLETIIAVSMLTIGILAVSQIFPFAFKITGLAAHTTVAVNLAQGTLEENSGNAYEDIAVGTTSVSSYDDPYSGYGYQAAINYIDQNLNAIAVDQGMKKIIVTVSWMERNKNKQIQLATIVNNN